MNAATLLWLVCGSLALLVIMGVIVIVARKLERASAAEAEVQPVRPARSQATPTTGQPDTASRWKTGSLSAVLTALAAQTGNQDTTPDNANKSVKRLITGFAVAGGVIALIMGIIAGDG